MAEPLKYLYSEDFVQRLAARFKKAYPAFRPKAFVKDVMDDAWESKELKQRTRHIVHMLHRHLPQGYLRQVEILDQVAPHFTGYPAVLFPDFIAVYGLNDLEASVRALGHFTQYSTSEFAVRPFIVKYPGQMIRQHLAWAKSSNHHVRRLASEGIRPRLPWAMALPEFKKDPSAVLPVLELLRNDESEYVRRSVANNLNDISKDHPRVVLDIVNRWKGSSRETDWIVKHASRGLLKRGHEEALSAFGLDHSVKAVVDDLRLSAARVKLNGELTFTFGVQLREKKEQQVRVEYRIYFVKATGKTSPKIFQVGTYTLAPAQHMSFSRKHKFTDLTTRRHHKGAHKLAIVVNGKELAAAGFMLV